MLEIKKPDELKWWFVCLNEIWAVRGLSYFRKITTGCFRLTGKWAHLFLAGSGRGNRSGTWCHLFCFFLLKITCDIKIPTEGIGDKGTRHRRLGKWMDEEWINEWMNEWMIEWMNEWMNEWREDDNLIATKTVVAERFNVIFGTWTGFHFRWLCSNIFTDVGKKTNTAATTFRGATLQRKLWIKSLNLLLSDDHYGW